MRLATSLPVSAPPSYVDFYGSDIHDDGEVQNQSHFICPAQTRKQLFYACCTGKLTAWRAVIVHGRRIFTPNGHRFPATLLTGITLEPTSWVPPRTQL